MNRDELMYRAGWGACAAASAAVCSTGQRAATWLWPLTTAALVVVAAMLGVALATREPAVQIVYIEKFPTSSAEAEKHEPSAAAKVAVAHQPLLSSPPMNTRTTGFGNDYLSLRERVLAFGVDVLPVSSESALPDTSPALRDSRYGALIGELRGG